MRQSIPGNFRLTHYPRAPIERSGWRRALPLPRASRDVAARQAPAAFPPRQSIFRAPSALASVLCSYGFLKPHVRAATIFAKRLGCQVIAVVTDSFFYLAGGNPHYMDRVADNVSGAFLAFRASWNRRCLRKRQPCAHRVCDSRLPSPNERYSFFQCSSP
jgi:hypothetical protein